MEYGEGACMAQLVAQLPLAWVVILESWDRVLHWDPCSVGSLLLPLTLPPLMLSVSLFLKLKKNGYGEIYKINT